MTQLNDISYVCIFKHSKQLVAVDHSSGGYVYAATNYNDTEFMNLQKAIEMCTFWNAQSNKEWHMDYERIAVVKF